MNIRTAISTAAFLLCSFLPNSSAHAEQRRILLGYFEGGTHPIHQQIRTELERQLAAVLPDSIVANFIPQGFRSGAWNRDSSRTYAKQLVSADRVDVMIAVGPWVVHDLLEAGYKKPIVAIYQYDPIGDGLITPEGRPIAKNLTVNNLANSIERDVVTAIRLLRPKRIGALFFHDSGTGEASLSQIKRACQKFNVTLQVEESYNNFGTFAFFAAYQKLSRKNDAVYVGPLWGMDAIRVNEFFRRAKDDRMPLITGEGIYAVQQGAMASNAGFTYLTEARLAALKVYRIYQGEEPDGLPVHVEAPTGLSFNMKTVTDVGANLPFEAIYEAALFGNDISENADSYTLSQAEYHATTSHPSALAASAILSSAIQNARGGIGVVDPRLSLDLSARTSSDEYVNNSRHWLSKSGIQGSLGLEATLLSIENLRRQQSARQASQLAEASQAAALGDLETATALAYAAVNEAEELMRAYRESRLAIERNLELTDLLTSLEGRQDAVERLFWETKRGEIMIKQITAFHDRERARILLNSLLNLPSSLPIRVDSNTFSEQRLFENYASIHPQIESSVNEQHLRELLMAQLWKTNPRYQAASADAALTESELAARAASNWPTLSVFGKGLYTNEQADIDGEFEEQDFSWTLGARLHWPLWGSSQERRERRSLKTSQQVMEYRRDSISLALMRDLQGNVSNLVEQMSTLPVGMQWRKLALSQYEKLATDFESGKLGERDVAEAHEDAEQASVLAIIKRYDFYRTIAELTNQLGWHSSNSQHDFVSDFSARLNALFPADDQDTIR